MILSDGDIINALDHGEIVLDPFDRARIGPCSVDLRLSPYLLVFSSLFTECLDPRQHPALCMQRRILKEDGHFILHPGEFILGSTMERIVLSPRLAGRIEGRSSVGRLGIQVHSTAGFFDAGWDGKGTLEISNVNRVPIKLYAGMYICQMSFQLLLNPARVPYGERESSKYQGSLLPEASRMYEEFA